MARRLSRRALLVGAGGSVAVAGGALALVDTGALPGRLTLHRALGAGDVGGPLPDASPGPTRDGTFDSEATDATRAGVLPARRRFGVMSVRPVPLVVVSRSPRMDPAQRARLVRRGRMLAWAGNVWHLVESAIAVAAGLAVGPTRPPRWRSASPPSARA